MNLEQEIRLAQQGDRRAFVNLMKHVEGPLHQTARAMVRKDEDIADALQETILKAYRSLHALREPAFFKTWIFRILINECNNILKKRTRSLAMAELPESAAGSDEFGNVDLRLAVDRLEDQLRIVIVLFYFQDMPLRQVADTLSISEGAVKTRLYRARKTLMETLESTGKEDVL